MPTSVGSIVISYVPGIPSEYDITKAKIAVNYTKELLGGNIFAAKDTIYICDREFDFA